MARVCTICAHPKREKIDRALIERMPMREIESTFKVGRMAAVRHAKSCLVEIMSKARDAADVASADRLLPELLNLIDRTKRILDDAEGEVTDGKRVGADNQTALKAIREVRENIKLLAELTGELQTHSSVNVTVSPEWNAIQGRIVAALEPFPDARVAVADALAKLRNMPAAGNA